MVLILVRHGEAVDDTVDPRRPLSRRGRGEIERTAHFLKQAGVSAKVFIHSAKLRAEETATILRDILNPRGVLEKKGQLGPSDPLGSILKEIAKSREDLIIAGHMPSLALLTAELVLGNHDQAIISLPTGGAVILEEENGHWLLRGLVDPKWI